MPNWDIRVAGVRRVLAATEAEAGKFESHIRGLNAALDTAVAEVASGEVTGAMDEFVAAQTERIGFVFTRTWACRTGAAQATTAYLDGDLEMAANAQAAASAAPDPTATMPGVGARDPR